MSITFNLPVGVFSAIFFVVHEFIALSIIGILIETFNNRRIRQKLYLGQPVVIRNTGFFHLYSSNIRSWTAFVGIIMMILVWLSVPIAELGVSSKTIYKLENLKMLHFIYAKDNLHGILTLSGENVTKQNYFDSQTDPAYQFNTFLYAATKCSKPLVTSKGENIGKQYFDMCLPAVKNHTLASRHALEYNSIIGFAARDPPEFACQDGEGGREKKEIAKVYQVEVESFEPKKYSFEEKEDGWIFIEGKWNDTHKIHTYTKKIDLSESLVCLISNKNFSQVLTKDSAKVESPEDASDKIVISAGTRKPGIAYKVWTTIKPEDVCRIVAQSPDRPNGETPDDLFGATAYPTSSLKVEEVPVTRSSRDGTEVSSWAFLTYLGTTIVIIGICLAGILTTPSGAKSIPGIVTKYDGIAKLLSRQNHSGDIEGDSDGSAFLGTTLEQLVEVKQEGGVLYLSARKRHGSGIDSSWDEVDRES